MTEFRPWSNLERGREKRQAGGVGATQCKGVTKEHRNVPHALSSGLPHEGVLLCPAGRVTPF